MKKLTTILGAFMFTAVVLTSCGGGETACSCMKDMLALATKTTEAGTDLEKIAEIGKESAALVTKCEDARKADADAYGDISDCK
jgi:hypothetical protein